MLVDFHAAFHNIAGKRVLAAVTEHAPGLLVSCKAWYGGCSTHVIHEQNGAVHEVVAGRGVDQGCPLRAFLFAVTMRNPADEVLRFPHSTDSSAAFYMYLDDCCIVSSPAANQAHFQQGH